MAGPNEPEPQGREVVGRSHRARRLDYLLGRVDEVDIIHPGGYKWIGG